MNKLLSGTIQKLACSELARAGWCGGLSSLAARAAGNFETVTLSQSGVLRAGTAGSTELCRSYRSGVRDTSDEHTTVPIAPNLLRPASLKSPPRKPRLLEASAGKQPKPEPEQVAADEYHINAKSFLIGSEIDLERLKPRFKDVLRAHGKDYLMLAVTPRERSQAATRVNEPSVALPPEHTYFVVFRFGAVVLFQGFPSSKLGRRRQQVTVPPEAVTVPLEADAFGQGFDNPWKATPATWRDAESKMDESQLIFLLLRPFIQESSDGVLFEELEDLNLSKSQFHQRAFTRFVQDDNKNKTLMYKESLQLVVRASQKQFIVQEPDLFAIRELDVGTLRCVAAALGQSSALDFYSSKVDTVLAEANTVNLAMARAGVFPKEMRGTNFLQRMIGKSSLIHSAVISQIGLMDKNDLAWQYDKYDRMLELLRVEFDLEKRLKNLEAKISVVADNANCFLSIQQHQKSNFLEWLIVFLIGAEICVSLLDMYTHDVPALLHQKLLGRAVQEAVESVDTPL